METQLQTYLADPDHSKPFDISTVPVVSKAQEQQDLQKIKQAQSELTSTGGAEETASPVVNLSSLDQQSLYAKNMSDIPQLAQLGVLFKSSAPVSLTESEEEYQITCIKHVFPQHFVFQVTLGPNPSLNVEIRLMITSLKMCWLIWFWKIAMIRLSMTLFLNFIFLLLNWDMRR